MGSHSNMNGLIDGQIVKNLSDITREEWICYHWMEDTPNDEDRVFMRSYKKTPTEAAQSAEDWDVTAEERGCE